VLLPRAAYVLVFTCIVTLIVERQSLIRVAAIPLMVIPATIGLATGGRGALVALVAAAVAYLGGLKRKGSVILGILILSVLGAIGYKLLPVYFPVLLERFTSSEDSGR